MTARDAAPDAVAGLDARRVQVLCWSILLAAFAVFVALAIGGPWAVWRWAHLATRRATAEVRVTAGGVDRCLRADCLPSLREAETWRAPEGATLELTVTSAYLTENRITEGPYRPAAPLRFKVQ